MLCSDDFGGREIGDEKLRLQRVKGRGMTNRSQLFKTTLFFAPKVMGKSGAPVIPASCTDPGWATHRGPREPSAMIMIRWFLRKTLIRDRDAEIAFL